LTGHFGCVYVARMRDAELGFAVKVAVKTLQGTLRGCLLYSFISSVSLSYSHHHLNTCRKAKATLHNIS